MDKGKTMHMCLDIDGTCKRPDHIIEGILTSDGKDFTAAEVREFLQNKKTEGYEVWAGCDNMDEKGYCQGHPID